jgi:uncharacterized RDD family membrane protein YckC
MSAPPAGSANGSPLPGYYPDPSIPGYIRYWDGTAWVPGTSRPQPGPGEPPPEPPVQRGVTRGGATRGGVPPQRAAAQQQSVPPVQEETGPVFLDEDDGRGGGTGAAAGTGVEEGGLPEVRQRGDVAAREEQAGSWDDPRRLHGESPGAGGAWQADASRQSGFGGEQDQRVSWGADAHGADEQPQQPAAPAESGDTIGIRLPRGGVVAQGAAEYGQQAPPQQAQAQVQPQQPHVPQWAEGGPDRQAQAPQQAQVYQQGPMQGQGGLGVGAPPQQPAAQQHGAPQQHGQAAPPWQQAPPQQAPQEAERPPWAQQVHDLAQQAGDTAAGQTPAGQEHVAPWRPPADDPFLRAAQAQARPAGLGRRFGAALLDGLLVAAVTAAAAFPFVGKATDHIQGEIDAARQAGVTRQIWLIDGTTGVYLAVVLGVFVVFGLLYEALPTSKWGRTLGKKLFGLTVLDVERQDPPRFGAALRRWLVHRVLGLLVIGVLDALWCLFDRPYRQCWHDKAAKTFVSGGVTAD